MEENGHKLWRSELKNFRKLKENGGKEQEFSKMMKIKGKRVPTCFRKNEEFGFKLFQHLERLSKR